MQRDTEKREGRKRGNRVFSLDLYTATESPLTVVFGSEL